MEAVAESSKPPPSAPQDDEGENERPTVVPPFDVEEMARRTRSSGPAGAGAHDSDDMPTVIPPPSEELRAARVATLVDEDELEVARVASMQKSSLPPALDPFRSAFPEPERPGDDPVLEVGGDDGLDPVDEARMLLDAGDEAAALAIVEGLLRKTPSNRAAREIAEECEEVLAAKYARELGSLTRVPRLAIPVDQLVSLSLDHRAGFLLSFVDGASSLATILDMSGMSASEVLRTFVELNDRRIIALR